MWSFVVLFLSCVVWCCSCSCRVFVCGACFSSYTLPPAGFKGTVVAITHDRYFLESACQWILGIYLRLLFLELLPRVEPKGQSCRLWVRVNPSPF